MYYVGIDIGSTASKTVVRGSEAFCFVFPTGWSSKETTGTIRKDLLKHGVDVYAQDVKIVATGYGRVSVDYADKTVTEITCHGKGGAELMHGDGTVIDVGGQDTKIITVEHGAVSRFMMNDKCSAGTGKFVEIMTNRLGVTIENLFELAARGKIITINALCTVFAESEIISYIAEGRPREDIAAGVVESVVSKVGLLCSRHGVSDRVILTGGLSGNPYFLDRLSAQLEQPVPATPMGLYAGAIGASLIAQMSSYIQLNKKLI